MIICIMHNMYAILKRNNNLDMVFLYTRCSLFFRLIKFVVGNVDTNMKIRFTSKIIFLK